MNVFDLSATLNLDTSEYEAGLSKASGMAKSVGSKIAGGIKTAGVAVGALAAVGTAVAGAFVGAAKKTADYGDNVDKMSQKLGLSAEGFQKWDYVLQIAGTDINSMSTGLKTLTNKIDDAKNGGAGAQEMFDKLGISMDELNKMSREEAFEATIKGFQGMEDSTERAALANDLFGKSGQNLTPLFNQTVKDTEAQIEMAEKYGMVMPDAAVKASAAFQDSLTTMSMTFEGLKNRMMAEFLPAMTQVTDGLGKLFAGDMSGADDVAEGLQGIIDKMGEVMPVLMEIGGKVLGHLGQAFIDNLPNLLSTTASMMMKIAGEIAKNIPAVVSAMGSMLASLASELASGAENVTGDLADMIPSLFENILNVVVDAVNKLADWLSTNGVDVIIAFGEGFIKALPTIISAMGQIINAVLRVVLALPVRLVTIALSAVGKFALGLLKGINNATKSAGKIASSVVKGIQKGLGAIASVAVKAVSNFASKIGSGVGAVASAAKRLASGVLNSLKNGLTGLGNIGLDIVKGIGKGITNGVGWIKGQIKSFVGNVKSFLKNLFGIKSPSKWARDVIGKNIDEGLALGITQNAGMVDDALEEVLPDVDAISTGVNLQPVEGAVGDGIKMVTFAPTINVDGAESPEEYAQRLMREMKLEARTA